MKIYVLEIGYDDETEEIEYITESIDEPAGITQDQILECEEYWDEDTMEIMRVSYSSGES